LSSVTSTSSDEHARRAEEALLALDDPGIGDVLDDVDGEDDVAAGIAHRRRLGQRPALLAGALVDGARERRRRGAAREGVAAGQLREVEGLAVLVEDDEALEQLAHRRGEDLIRRCAAEHLCRCLVDVDEAAVGRLHGDRRGEVGEHRLELALGPAQLGEETRVVEGERGAAGDLGGQLDVVLRIGRRGAEAQEAEHADRSPARDERDGKRARVARAPHQLQVLVVDREGAQLLGADLVLHVRLAGARDDRDRVRPGDVEWVARPRDAQQLGGPGVDRVDRGLAQLTVADEVDGAQLGHVGHGEAHDLLEHRVGLRRRLEQAPGAGGEVRAHARRALVGQRLEVGLARARGHEPEGERGDDQQRDDQRRIGEDERQHRHDGDDGRHRSGRDPRRSPHHARS
jgi:hypothetical protein